MSLKSDIYRGDDGGALYLRLLGETVWAFGEHPGKKYAFVLQGKVQGDKVVGRFWDVPKGTRTESGSVELQISQDGNRLVRRGSSIKIGVNQWDKIAPGSFPWPNRQGAGFQSTKTSDLDGVFVGDDFSRHYLREIGGDIVWVAEADMQPTERPAWVSIFVGSRSTNGIGGEFADVPKGLSSKFGRFGAGFMSGNRALVLDQTGIDRARLMRPEYAQDFDVFSDHINDALDGKAVGYAFAIGRNGAILRSGAGGFRVLPQNGEPAKFTVNTQSAIASCSKTFTAAALVKSLHDKGLDVDAKIAPFLPGCWEQGPGVKTITFRQILDHTSRLTKPSVRDPYENPRQMIAIGRTDTRDYFYNNAAYGLMRLLVPIVAMKAKDEFTLHKCDNKDGVLNKKVSEQFANYMLKMLNNPVNDVEVKISLRPSGNVACMYNHSNRSLNGEGAREDAVEWAGPGYIYISAVELVGFLGALNRGAILPKSLVESMYAGNLGFDGPASGKAGKYYTKNGGATRPSGVGAGAQIMMFPSDIQACVIVNSVKNSYSGSLAKILRDAFDKSLK